MDFHTVLVPVDFSEPARRAFRYALAFARREGASLLVVNAIHVPSEIRMTGAWWSTLRSAATRELAALEEEAQRAGVTVETLIRDEQPSEAILALAEERRTDLIAIGSRGLGALRHALLGSVTRKVVANAPCPVLSLSHDDEAAPAETVSRVLVATDFSEPARAALSWAAEFARERGAALHVLHAQHVDVPVLPTGTYVLPPALIDDMLVAARKQLEAEVESVRSGELEVSCDVVWGPAADAIRDAAHTRQADWVVLGTRGRGGAARMLLGSVAERTIQLAPCPVITLRA